MAWSASYNHMVGVVEIVFTDIIGGEDLQAATGRAIALQREYGVKNALISVSEQAQSAPAVDIYYLPDQYEAAGVSRDVRLAFILPQKPDLQETVRFYEDVCINRGWQVQLFPCRQEALEWFQTAPA